MRSLKLLLPLLASGLCFAQQPDRITGPIDSGQMVALPGHAHRYAKPEFDQGPVEPSFQFGRVTLVMAPSPSQQIALNLLLAQQQDRSSPNYHKWLTPEQFAERFGVSQGDINKITAWLESQGFQVFGVPRGRTSVGFSGTAAQIQSAFKTEIHRYSVDGQMHIANSTPVEVPAALNGVVTGVRGLTDFHPKPMYVRPVHGGRNGTHPSYTSGVGAGYVLAPGDIGTIYDLNPLYTASPAIDGTGQKLAIIGQTDIYLADIADFRSNFGLNTISCSTDANGIVTATACNTTNFQYILVPGVADLGTPSTCGDLPEADLDIEWSGATARNAQIIFVNAPATFNSQCTEITNNGGTNVSLAYAIDNVVAPVISMSYGLCEAEAESMESELQKGNAEGITIMNSSGDSGAAGCDGQPSNSTLPYDPAIGGLAVNYPASSPEVTGVGGTSIPYPTFYNGTYWDSNSSSTVSFGDSANTNLEGHEASWNDTAAFAQLCEEGDLNPQFCSQGGSKKVTGWVDITSAATAQQDLWVSAGGGGVSNCVTESGVICEAGFPRPSWQAVTIPGQGSPQSTYRLVPDVSLLASPDFPGYIFCTPLDQWGFTGTTSTCANGIATAIDTYSSIVGGTSASSPVFAGIVTVLNQYLGTGSGGLGNINPTLYSLAATPANGAFHQITNGDNDVYCLKNTPSGQPSDVICPTAGVFGFDASSSDSTTGYNPVGGLGSVDGNSLAIAWKATLAPDFALTASALNPTSISAGQSATSTLTISPISGSTAMVVNFSPSSCTGLPTGATCSFNPASVTFTGLNSPTTTVTIATLPNMAASGPTTITITPTNSSGTNTTVSLTVTATTESFTLAATNGATFPVTVGGATSVIIAVNGMNGFIVGSGASAATALPLTYTCTGSPSLATAEIACQISPGNGQPTSATSVSISLTTTAPTAQLRRPLDRGSRIFYAMLLPGLFGIVFAAGSRTRGARLLSLIVVLGFSTLWLGSCDGGGGGGTTIPPNPGTPAGTYVVTIGATTTGGANNLANSNAPYTITLNVSQ
ncbi:MAG: protease pro-enzyme activation domain-containing protein [Candidatus Sulfotelmatobacter sp.]